MRSTPKDFPNVYEIANIHKLSNYDLILQCQAGLRPGKSLFAELIRRHHSHIEKVLYHLAPDWNDRADLAREVWIRVYRHIKRLKDPAKFRGWLTRITTNLFYDELRKRERSSTLSPLDVSMEDEEIDWEVVSDNLSLVENVITRELCDQLRDAIADLPNVFLITIILRDIEGMDYEEIAEITGVSPGTVKSRISRARQRLQYRLQTYLEGIDDERTTEIVVNSEEVNPSNLQDKLTEQQTNFPDAHLSELVVSSEATDTVPLEKEVWRSGDRAIAFAAGGAFFGGLIAQIPGAVVGALAGTMFGWFEKGKPANSSENSR